VAPDRYYDVLVFAILGFAGELFALLGRRAIKSLRDWMIFLGCLVLFVGSFVAWYLGETEEAQFWTIVLFLPIATIFYVLVFVRSRRKAESLKLNKD
jgi:uncharacterized membrane protein HdeD (DUF308 family)